MNPELSLKTKILQILGVAAVLGLSFYANTKLLENTSFNVIKGVDLIFLPAFIKMAAVVIFGWRGAIGLLLGILPLGDYVGRESYIAFIDLLIFAFGPMFALIIVQKICYLPNTMSGLKPKHIFYLATVAAFIQSLNKFTHHQSFELSFNLFCGDMIGTVVMLLFLSICMRYYEFSNRKGPASKG